MASPKAEASAGAENLATTRMKARMKVTVVLRHCVALTSITEQCRNRNAEGWNKSEILIGFARGNSGFISRRGVVCAAARRTWLDARCVLCAGQRFENHTWLWAIRKFKAANKSCMFTLCVHCSSWARAKSGVTFKYTMLAKWNLSDWGDRCPSVVNNSGRLCGVKLFGCISICSTFNASVRFSGDCSCWQTLPKTTDHSAGWDTCFLAAISQNLRPLYDQRAQALCHW